MKTQLIQVETKSVPVKKYFCVTRTATLEKIPEVAMQEADAIMEEFAKLNVQAAGPMEFIYFGSTYDPDGALSIEIAIPVSEDIKGSGKYSVKQLGEFKCISHLYSGDFSRVNEVYEMLFADLAKNGIKHTPQVREVYHEWKSMNSPDNRVEIQIGIE